MGGGGVRNARRERATERERKRKHFALANKDAVTLGKFFFNLQRNGVAQQVADEIARVPPLFATCLATKYCVASCRKSSLGFYFLQRCEISCNV